MWRDHKRKWVLPLWVTLGLSVVVSYVMKSSILRLRPYQLDLVSTLPILEKANHLVWNSSFPSFHAMLVFCAIPLLSKEFPKLKYFWIIFAGIIGLSRVYFGVHFLSDVLIGGIIGYALGMSVIKIEKKTGIFGKAYSKIFKK